jgi:hypothetical protein
VVPLFHNLPVAIGRRNHERRACDERCALPPLWHAFPTFQSRHDHVLAPCRVIINSHVHANAQKVKDRQAATRMPARPTRWQVVIGQLALSCSSITTPTRTPGRQSLTVKPRSGNNRLRPSASLPRYRRLVWDWSRPQWDNPPLVPLRPSLIPTMEVR